MAVERANPLPRGRYWVNASGDAAIDQLDKWMADNNATVHPVKSEFDPGAPGPFTNPVPVQWVLFDVMEPTTWNGPGLPEIATVNVQSQADTVQRPEPWTWGGAAQEQASEWFFGPNTSTGLVVGALLLLWLYSKSSR